MPRIATVVALLGFIVGLVLLWQGSKAAGPVLVADPVRTPGVLNPEVRQETIGDTICTRGWTRTVRPPTSYTNALKLRQMQEYGVGGDPSGYQEDHLSVSSLVETRPTRATSGPSLGRTPRRSTGSRTS